MSTETPSRPRRLTLAVIAGAALAGIVLGAGGSTLALWNDGASREGSVGSGAEWFAAGHPGSTSAAPDGTAAVSVGAAEAETLLSQGSVAVPFQTDSMSQGNLGLRYTVAEPKDWGDGVFGAADTALFPVASAADCTVSAVPHDGSSLTSTPVPADYSGSETPTTEFWCLVASVEQLPGTGAYANTASATATAPDSASVTAQDRWSTRVTTLLDAADESDHELTFTYETFRPER